MNDLHPPEKEGKKRGRRERKGGGNRKDVWVERKEKAAVG